MQYALLREYLDKIRVATAQPAFSDGPFHCTIEIFFLSDRIIGARLHSTPIQYSAKAKFKAQSEMLEVAHFGWSV